MNRMILIICFSIINMQEFDGYTLFTPFSSNEEVVTTILMDNENNFINTWSHDFIPASMPYLLADSSIIYPYKVESPSMIAGGVGGGIQKLSWDGAIIWNYIFADTIYQHHHDIEPLPNGNILIIVWEKKTVTEAYNMGRIDVAEWPFNEMWSTAILELNPLSGLIVWEWHLWDHLVQDVNYGLPNYGIISDFPELFNINCGSVGGSAGGPTDPNGDWMHINAIDYNSNLDQIILSSRLQNELYIIDHSTTTEEAASHVGGYFGKGGDILYRWGNPMNYNRGDDSDKVLASQHSVNWIQHDYPGSGNLILFNNFHEGSYSTVIELSPSIDNSGDYIISDNEPFGPTTLEWEYTCDLVVPMQGGSFRLPNGNTIITLTHIAKIIEVDSVGTIVWEYIHTTNQINNYWIARANKYSLDYFQNIILGDINTDGIINILDIVMVVNIVLSGEFIESADLNVDGSINILDIVQLVNIILS